MRKRKDLIDFEQIKLILGKKIDLGFKKLKEGIEKQRTEKEDTRLVLDGFKQVLENNEKKIVKKFEKLLEGQISIEENIDQRDIDHGEILSKLSVITTDSNKNLDRISNNFKDTINKQKMVILGSIDNLRVTIGIHKEEKANNDKMKQFQDVLESIVKSGSTILNSVKTNQKSQENAAQIVQESKKNITPPLLVKVENERIIYPGKLWKNSNTILALKNNQNGAVLITKTNEIVYFTISNGSLHYSTKIKSLGNLHGLVYIKKLDNYATYSSTKESIIIRNVNKKKPLLFKINSTEFDNTRCKMRSSKSHLFLSCSTTILIYYISEDNNLFSCKSIRPLLDLNDTIADFCVGENYCIVCTKKGFLYYYDITNGMQKKMKTEIILGQFEECYSVAFHPESGVLMVSTFIVRNKVQAKRNLIRFKFRDQNVIEYVSKLELKGNWGKLMGMKLLRVNTKWIALVSVEFGGKGRLFYCLLSNSEIKACTEAEIYREGFNKCGGFAVIKGNEIWSSFEDGNIQKMNLDLMY